jgi:hypothetical protein
MRLNDGPHNELKGAMPLTTASIMTGAPAHRVSRCPGASEAADRARHAVRTRRLVLSIDLLGRSVAVAIDGTAVVPSTNRNFA